MRFSAAIAVYLVASLLTTAAGADTGQDWRFNVQLDGSPIGFQNFHLSREGGQSRISIEASFDVKILFFTAYTYRHSNVEIWEKGCLRSMQSKTDDNGKLFHVSTAPNEVGLFVETASGRQLIEGCVASFAYWDRKALGASHLLNSQTGEYEEVTLRELRQDSVQFRGQAVPARHVAIEGKKLHIDLWYSLDDDWLALESMTTSGRKLSYSRQ